MSKPTDQDALDALMPHMPDVIKEAVAKHGFDKLAAAMFELPEINEKTVATFIGTKLAAQQQDWAQIVAGLTALRDLRG
jgi:hypothetical protein